MNVESSVVDSKMFLLIENERRNIDLSRNVV